MIARGELEDEWRANTYDDAGQLDVFGSTRQTVVDESLRDAVAAASGGSTPIKELACPGVVLPVS